MKILLTSLALIVMVSMTVYGADIFTDSEIKDLQVISVYTEDGIALIRDGEQNESEVVLGDEVGIDRAIVVEIGKASITVQKDNTRTKMPVVYGFE